MARVFLLEPNEALRHQCLGVLAEGPFEASVLGTLDERPPLEATSLPIVLLGSGLSWKFRLSQLVCLAQWGSARVVLLAPGAPLPPARLMERAGVCAILPDPYRESALNNELLRISSAKSTPGVVSGEVTDPIGFARIRDDDDLVELTTDAYTALRSFEADFLGQSIAASSDSMEQAPSRPQLGPNGWTLPPLVATAAREVSPPHGTPAAAAPPGPASKPAGPSAPLPFGPGNVPAGGGRRSPDLELEALVRRAVDRRLASLFRGDGPLSAAFEEAIEDRLIGLLGLDADPPMEDT